jgi:chromosome segregation ATPase
MADLNFNINVQGNAGEAIGSLKKQLREAQNEVAALSDKFGATSKEAIEAAKRAADLRDRIGDARALTEAFNPDKKFKALSETLGALAGGFSAVQGAIGLLGADGEQLEKTLLKVQSALALSQGLEQLGDLGDAFQNLKTVAINAFNGIKTAIGSTGIGLLVVALGAIYAYWDDIKAVVSGVSEEQKN